MASLIENTLEAIAATLRDSVTGRDLVSLNGDSRTPAPGHEKFVCATSTRRPGDDDIAPRYHAWVQIGDISILDDSTDAEVGLNMIVRIEVFVDNNRGNKSSLFVISDDVRKSLHRQEADLIAHGASPDLYEIHLISDDDESLRVRRHGDRRNLMSVYFQLMFHTSPVPTLRTDDQITTTRRTR